ncbi:unnamed protein product [Soboliphyme baturini]|uniref:Fibrocystin-L n=1 Tax=Soboliphyme baturini TaxID=241478 RepID=A0A183JAV1_9BILA|nr:unnamed protein product [Soboliphyme baturini]
MHFKIIVESIESFDDEQSVGFCLYKNKNNNMSLDVCSSSEGELNSPSVVDLSFDVHFYTLEDGPHNKRKPAKVVRREVNREEGTSVTCSALPSVEHSLALAMTQATAAKDCCQFCCGNGADVSYTLNRLENKVDHILASMNVVIDHIRNADLSKDKSADHGNLVTQLSSIPTFQKSISSAVQKSSEIDRILQGTCRKLFDALI